MEIFKNRSSIGLVLVFVIAAGGCACWFYYSSLADKSSSVSPKTPKNVIYYQNKAVILLYHNFNPKECGTAITSQRFMEHMNMLREEGFQVVSLEDVEDFMNHKKSLPDNAVAITMDDGYRSNYEVAYPILKKLNWSASIFVKVEDTTDQEKGTWLSWAQLREMSQNGIAVYSHSYHGHRFISGDYPKGKAWLSSPMPGETEEAYEQRIYLDLVKSRDILGQHLTTQNNVFCIPFGMYNQALLDAANKVGFKYLLTTKHYPVMQDTSPSQIGRLSVGIGGTSPQKVKEEILKIADMKSGKITK